MDLSVSESALNRKTLTLNGIKYTFEEKNVRDFSFVLFGKQIECVDSSFIFILAAS